MKKYLILISSLLFLVYLLPISYAKETLLARELDYKYTLDGKNEPYFFWFYDDNGKPFFNITHDNKTAGYYCFVESTKYNLEDWKLSKSDYDLFKRIVYYGYQVNPSEDNYFLTQMMIWNKIGNLQVGLQEVTKKRMPDFDKEWDEVWQKVIAKVDTPVYTTNLWDTVNLNFSNIKIKEVDGLKVSYLNDFVSIYNEKAGTYNLEISYDDEYVRSFVFEDPADGSMYWQSLGNPGLVSTINYHVSGVKVSLIENVNGIDNFWGDADPDSKYELYLDNTKILDITTTDFMVSPNQTYTLKVLDNKGFQQVEDIEFSIQDKPIELTIPKYVISKTYSVNIKDDNSYQVYLKSNNKLYKTIDNTTNVLTLPYGSYVIKLNDKIKKELNVWDQEDALLEIDNNYLDEEITNPKTNSKDNIIVIIITILLGILFMLINKYQKMKKCQFTVKKYDI